MDHRIFGCASGLLLILCSIASGAQSDWEQMIGGQAATSGGFGNTNNIRITHIVLLNDEYFAATYNSHTGPEIWKSENAYTWVQMHSGGIGSTDPSLHGMVSFTGVLLAAPSSADACIWESSTGGNWTPANGPCADPVLGNEEVWSFKAFGNHLFASTSNQGFGGEIWRSLDGITWEPVMTGGFGASYNAVVGMLEEFQGHLYAATDYDCEIWRSDDGLLWTRVVETCFGSYNDIRTLEPFGGSLYAGVGWDGLPGFNLWSSTNGVDWIEGAYEPSYRLTGTRELLYSSNFSYEIIVSSNGTDWISDNDASFGNPNNWYYTGFFVIDGYIYAGVQNSAEGAQLWRKFLGLFADGFETGDTARWSSIIP